MLNNARWIYICRSYHRGYSLFIPLKEKQGIRNEATRYYTPDHWRTRERHGKGHSPGDRIRESGTKPLWCPLGLCHQPGKSCDWKHIETFRQADHQADLMGQATMVQCSDLYKSEFYSAHGFKSVADVVLGDQNPRWHNVPVTVKIVSRPQSHFCMSLILWSKMIREPGGE